MEEIKCDNYRTRENVRIEWGRKKKLEWMNELMNAWSERMNWYGIDV